MSHMPALCKGFYMKNFVFMTYIVIILILQLKETKSQES